MIEVGQVEGFAHFFAGDVLNNDGQPNCSFSYYKEFKLPSGTEEPPPYIVSCYNPERWMESQCPAGQADQGTEYDWMGFFWYLNNGGTSSQDLSYDAIETVWKAQCSGSRLE